MTQINAEVLLVSDLFLRGEFIVPWHQRYYDWDSTQVSELLVDIDEALTEGRSSYFLGSIMLIRRDGKLEVNDGQQRLITLSLIFAALSRRFEQPPDYDSECVALCTRVLFVLPHSALASPRDRTHLLTRFSPPKQDRARFGQIVRGREIGTNGKLTSAWQTIGLFVRGMGSTRAKTFLEFLAMKVEIAVLHVPVTEDINSIFEALNGRGKTLDDLDLIRNHLYSYFSGSKDGVRRQTMHERIESALATTRTASKSQAYFRCFFQCEYGFLQKNRFYRETRQQIRSHSELQPCGDYAYGLVERLADLSGVELFRTMTSSVPSADLVGRFRGASRTGTSKRHLGTFLRELHSYTVVHPLLFALMRQFIRHTDSSSRRRTARALHRSISDLTSFVMRVSFCALKFEPSKFEPTLANCAHRVSHPNDIEDLDIFEDLRELDDLDVMSDTRFIEYMAGMHMSDARRAKRYLFGINTRLQADSSVIDINGCTVEHVLPKSSDYWHGWQGFSKVGPDLSSWVTHMGNLTLLGRADNRPSSRFNASYAAKSEVFTDSSFQITRNLSRRFPEWSPSAIEKRSEKLAKEASKVWKFSRVS